MGEYLWFGDFSMRDELAIAICEMLYMYNQVHFQDMLNAWRALDYLKKSNYRLPL